MAKYNYLFVSHSVNVKLLNDTLFSKYELEKITRIIQYVYLQLNICTVFNRSYYSLDKNMFSY